MQKGARIRGRFAIIASILRSVEHEGKIKSRIMYKANLNAILLNKYLKKLIKYKLIEEKDGMFTVTVYGVIWLRNYRTNKMLLGESIR